jgi:medium-chain acyl-[acyl-carrier-protein] hydrolase
VRLFCFPFAGSGANLFYDWSRSLPDDVELCLVHLPGRERRMKEPPFDRMSRLVEALAGAVLPNIDRPVAFFGHSMGALVSFELSRYLRRYYGLEPAQLFISGCSPPRSVNSWAPIHNLPSAQFLKALNHLQGGALEGPNGQFLNLMLPTLRADLAVCETYSYTEELPLQCAMSVYGGLQDSIVRIEHLNDWRRETTGRFCIRLFEGSHFFLKTDEAMLLRALGEELRILIREAD